MTNKAPRNEHAANIAMQQWQARAWKAGRDFAKPGPRPVRQQAAKPGIVARIVAALFNR